jgi:hypothetical protein
MRHIDTRSCACACRFQPEQELRQPLVAATLAVYSRVAAQLLPTPTRSHYTFNMRDISRCVQVWGVDGLSADIVLLILWLWVACVVRLASIGLCIGMAVKVVEVVAQCAGKGNANTPGPTAAEPMCDQTVPFVHSQGFMMMQPSQLGATAAEGKDKVLRLWAHEVRIAGPAFAAGCLKEKKERKKERRERKIDLRPCLSVSQADA